MRCHPVIWLVHAPKTTCLVNKNGKYTHAYAGARSSWCCLGTSLPPPTEKHDKVQHISHSFCRYRSYHQRNPFPSLLSHSLPCNHRRILRLGPCRIFCTRLRPITTSGRHKGCLISKLLREPFVAKVTTVPTAYTAALNTVHAVTA